MNQDHASHARLLVTAALIVLWPLGIQAQPTTPANGPTAQSMHQGLTFTVSGLKRTSGNTVTLSLLVKNASSQKPSPGDIDWGDKFAPGQEVYRLLDMSNGKRYYPLRDSAGHCVCTQLPSDYAEKLVSGGTINLYIKFPAPPESVKQISIELPGGAAPLEDVPIAN